MRLSEAYSYTSRPSATKRQSLHRTLTPKAAKREMLAEADLGGVDTSASFLAVQLLDEVRSKQQLSAVVEPAFIEIVLRNGRVGSASSSSTNYAIQK